MQGGMSLTPHSCAQEVVHQAWHHEEGLQHTVLVARVFPLGEPNLTLLHHADTGQRQSRVRGSRVRVRAESEAEQSQSQSRVRGRDSRVRDRAESEAEQSQRQRQQSQRQRQVEKASVATTVLAKACAAMAHKGHSIQYAEKSLKQASDPVLHGKQ